MVKYQLTGPSINTVVEVNDFNDLAYEVTWRGDELFNWSSVNFKEEGNAFFFTGTYFAGDYEVGMDDDVVIIATLLA